MGTANRRWTVSGITVRGSAPGVDDIVWAATRYPDEPGLVDELHEVAVAFAALQNGKISSTEQAVLDAALAYQAESPLPAPVRDVAEATGLALPTVHRAFDRLVEAGLGTRPPKGTRGLRPFRAHMPETADR